MNILFPLALIGTGLYFATRTSKAAGTDVLPPKDPTGPDPTPPTPSEDEEEPAPSEPDEEPTRPDIPKPPTQYSWQQVINPADGCIMQTGRTYRYSHTGPHYTRMEELAELPLGTIFPSNWMVGNWQQYEFKWTGETGFYRWPWAMFEHGEKLEVRVP